VVTIAAWVAGSSPYVKPPLKSTWSFGAETVGVEPPDWPGTTMRIA
jgi:N-acetylmuramic acid 6-phosphate (MurNAc-6-P) etherase